MVRLVVLLLLESLSVMSARGATYRVGGDKGWVVGLVNYTEWAANYTFYAGDALVFLYEPEVHTVLAVNKSGYEECSTGSAKASYEDGNTSIELRQAGSYFFICGVFQHCPAGQKLQVVALEAPAPAPPRPPNTPPPRPLMTAHGAPQPTNLGTRLSPFLYYLSWGLCFYTFLL
ncbi:hypothetical protein L7F22_014955 [Adiantum nelumboides]|nr:hypothetical protein [Adiantum nelumboides]